MIERFGNIKGKDKFPLGNRGSSGNKHTNDLIFNLIVENY